MTRVLVADGMRGCARVERPARHACVRFAATWLVVALLVACGLPKSVVDARAAWRAACAGTPECTPGKGECFNDPAADAVVCLCDHGCYYGGGDR